jgi:hypothetical protein
LQKVVNQGKDICTAPVFRSKPDLDGGFLEGGFWKYNTKPSNILTPYGENDEEESDEKHTIQDDVNVSAQDVAAGLIRMGILPRICSLLEVSFLLLFLLSGMFLGFTLVNIIIIDIASTI